MKEAMRLIVTFLAFFASFFFIYWVPLALISSFGENRVLLKIVSLLCACVVGMFVWKKSQTIGNSLAVYIVKGGIILGAIGFVAGFIGPIIFRPDANQGPLLGILITGPLGFIIGLFGGALFWFMKKRKEVENT